MPADDRLLMVASDRISTYDVVHPTPIPDKGKVLTGLTDFWLEHTGQIVPQPPDLVHRRCPTRCAAGRMLVERLEMVPVECVVRGYITGSGWKDYRRTGAVCGIELPAGLRESEQLPGADLHARHQGRAGRPRRERRLRPRRRDRGRPRAARGAAPALARALRARRRSTRASAGSSSPTPSSSSAARADGTIVLGDEVLTPDSSRFWPADGYEPGRAQPSFDKQFVRDWASSSGWDKSPPAPPLPDDVVEGTRARYLEAYERITDEPFSAWLERSRRVRARVLIRPKAGHPRPAGPGGRAGAARARLRGRDATCASAAWSSSRSTTRAGAGDVRAAAGQPADRGLRGASRASESPAEVRRPPLPRAPATRSTPCWPAGASATRELLWHGDRDLGGVDAVVVPGGFSYGDYLRAGAIARFSPVMEAVADFAARRRPGARHLQRLPGAVRGGPAARRAAAEHLAALRLPPGRRRGGRTPTRPSRARARRASALSIPVKHTTGRYYAPARRSTSWRRRPGAPALRARARTPTARCATSPAWPTRQGNVVGLMPHPEHAVDPLTGSADGGTLFASLVAHVDALVATA